MKVEEFKNESQKHIDALTKLIEENLKSAKEEPDPQSSWLMLRIIKLQQAVNGTSQDDML